MKKTTLSLMALLCLLFINSESYGQLSLQVGVNSAATSYSVEGLSLETDAVIGFHAGINYRSQLGEKLYLTPGLHFSQKGAKIDFGFGESTTTVNYIDVPIMFTYRSDPEKGFFAEGGPYLGLLLSADSEGEDIKDEYKSIDFGIGAGLGYDLGQFLLGIRYNIGIANIADTEGEEEGKATNTVLQLFGAYKF